MTKFDEENHEKRVRVPRQGKRKFWTCYKCKNTFNHQPDFKNHIAICGNNENSKQQFQCPFCPVKNARKRDLINRHIAKYHGEKIFEVVTNPSLIIMVQKCPEGQKLEDSYSLADEEDYVNELDQSIMGNINLGSMSEREALEEQVTIVKTLSSKSSPMTTAEQGTPDNTQCEGPLVSAGKANTERVLVPAGEAGNQIPVTKTVGQPPASEPLDQAQLPKGQAKLPEVMGRAPVSEPEGQAKLPEASTNSSTPTDSVRDQATSAKTCCAGGMIPRGPKPQPKKKDPSERCPHNIPLPVLELINREKHHPNGLKEFVKDVRINCPMCTPYDLLREFGVHQYKK